MKNHLEDLEKLSNRYFILRHGHSLANEQDMIVSAPANGTDAYGLSPTGTREVETAIKNAMENRLFGPNPITIYSSPFLRAVNTARITALHLDVQTIVFDSRLRERFFGDFELKKSDNYQTVWDDDSVDPHHQRWNVESTAQVLSRTTSLVSELERAGSGKTYILVTHGDPGQILETGFRNMESSEHRSLDPLTTAELREMKYFGYATCRAS